MTVWVQLQDAARIWRTWPARRHLVTAGAALLTVLVVAVPTAMIPTPVFGREVAVTVWAWPVLLVTAVLSGVLSASYVGGPATVVAPPDAGLAVGPVDAGGERPGRFGAAGGLLTFLAVGCPVCNKLALLALGYAGAIQWFAPVQPWLGAAGIALLLYALVRRLPNEAGCPVPARGAQRVG
ncbi:MAG: hypothetical protein KJ792_10420 [Actinobacteria bacterium]|nr:hypothetical protein [Actinomycetota bacterium]MCG2802322.1 hypothetical protein [Cellulomonas sp.]